MPVVGLPFGSVVARKNSMFTSVPFAPRLPAIARKSSLRICIWLWIAESGMLPVPLFA